MGVLNDELIDHRDSKPSSKTTRAPEQTGGKNENE